MRHQKRNAKLGRNGSHREALLASLVRSLIKHKRITTTLAKAKAAAPVAEKMVTLGKRGTLHDRRLAAARLKFQSRGAHAHKDKGRREAYRKYDDVVRILFEDIAPQFEGRSGGYTRIVKLPYRRRGDAGEQAMLMWVDSASGGSSQEKQSVVERADDKSGEAEELAEASGSAKEEKSE